MFVIYINNEHIAFGENIFINTDYHEIICDNKKYKYSRNDLINIYAKGRNIPITITDNDK